MLQNNNRPLTWNQPCRRGMIATLRKRNESVVPTQQTVVKKQHGGSFRGPTASGGKSRASFHICEIPQYEIYD